MCKDKAIVRALYSICYIMSGHGNMKQRMDAAKCSMGELSNVLDIMEETERLREKKRYVYPKEKEAHEKGKK